jgi:hypothetical protein
MKVGYSAVQKAEYWAVWRAGYSADSTAAQRAV